MKKAYLINLAIFTSLLFCLTAQAQVTIGSLNSPSENALLDLKETSTGTSTHALLLPRVALQSTISPAPMSSHEEGMCVYNTATTSTGTNDVLPGIYLNDGVKWIRMGSALNYFYMPSILLPLDTADPAYSAGTFTVDLYVKYAEQYNLTLPGSAKNPGATSLPVYSRTELEYFIIYYDNAVFSNVAVDNNGVMTYQLVSSPVVSEKTYMNIVFKVK